jgi:hypothetical protein
VYSSVGALLTTVSGLTGTSASFSLSSTHDIITVTVSSVLGGNECLQPATATFEYSSSGGTSGFILAEDGTQLITETGDPIILE